MSNHNPLMTSLLKNTNEWTKEMNKKLKSWMMVNCEKFSFKGGRRGLVVITLAWRLGGLRFKCHSRKKNFHLSDSSFGKNL